jgi:hypothetical protein
LVSEDAITERGYHIPRLPKRVVVADIIVKSHYNRREFPRESPTVRINAAQLAEGL